MSIIKLASYLVESATKLTGAVICGVPLTRNRVER